MSYNYNLAYLSDLNFKILDYDHELFCRTGHAFINQKKIETPALWLGHVIGGHPHPWKSIEINTLIVNAYDILKNKNATNTICEEGIHKYLQFKGAILMDSGGFSFQKKEEIDIDPLDIIELYELAKPDLGVILDHPFNPSESNATNKKRWKKTLKNTKIMLDNKGNVDLMPVIHGYNFKELKLACNSLKKLINPHMVGIGSLVPLIFRTNGTNRFKNPIQYVIDAIRIVREEFPESLLHAFGVGSCNTMHLMYSLGVDSLDSTGWRIKSAYGMIQLPGVGDRYPISRNNRRAFLNPGEKKLLNKCQCPTCNDKGIQDRIQILNDDFSARAIHNAFVFTNEQKIINKKIKEGKSKEFVKKRLNNRIFKPAFNYVVEKRRSVD